MILLVDIGNSRIKWCVLEKAQPGASSAIAHDGQWPEAVLHVWQGLPPVSRVLVASVVAGLDRPLLDTVSAIWGCEVEFAASVEQGFGVQNGYREPGRLGVDRWVTLVAAHHRYGNACVFDFGTALTVDVVAEGRHLGGLIVPGYRLMLSSLQKNTCGLRQEGMVDIGGSSGVFGRDTGEAMGLGAMQALAALTDRVAERMADRISGQRPVVNIVCGGDAPDVLPWLQRDYHHVPDLVLRGLAVMAREAQ